MKLGTIIFMIGQLVVGGLGSLAIIILFISGIYILFAKSIALGLMFIGASVVASWIIYLLSGSLMALGMKLSENAALKLEESGEDEKLIDALNNEAKVNIQWVNKGVEIASDCLTNGLSNGGVVKLSEITKLINDNEGSKANIVENGFLKKMNQFIDSGIVLNLSVEDGDTLFVHKEYAHQFINDIKT